MEASFIKELEFSSLPLNPYSLGMVSEFLSRSFPFGNFRLSEVMGTLTYQLSHDTNIILSENDRIVGYIGWIRTSNQSANDWIERGEALAPLTDGDVVIITIFAILDSQMILKSIREMKKKCNANRVIWRRYFLDSRQSQIRQITKYR